MRTETGQMRSTDRDNRYSISHTQKQNKEVTWCETPKNHALTVIPCLHYHHFTMISESLFNHRAFTVVMVDQKERIWRERCIVDSGSLCGANTDFACICMPHNNKIRFQFDKFNKNTIKRQKTQISSFSHRH